MNQKIIYFIALWILPYAVKAQDVVLYEQFNGRYDFTFTGNTLNLAENNFASSPCDILTTSSATLQLEPDDNVIAAYLYWAGSGNGDYNVLLNGQDITAQRQFLATRTAFELVDGVSTLVSRNYFSAFADITTQVQTEGSTTYTLSDFDLTDIINENEDLFCRNATNFGGWAIVVVYENTDFPLNQINLYDGYEFVPQSIDITLPSLNVIDNEGAKIGFLAWEGDVQLATETLSINGSVLSNPPLNPANNAFNGTNSVTEMSGLFNMDLDIYNIQNNIQIGDETAEISLTSTQDLVLINAIITKLNSQLPDATIEVNNISQNCNEGTVTLDYTVYNVNSTEVLPAGTPIAFYIEGDFITGTVTTQELPIGGSESGSVTLTIPAGTPLDYEIMIVVDDTGNGTGGIVTETDETNNSLIITVSQNELPSLPVPPEDITGCETDNGTNVGIFDFSDYETLLQNNPTDIVTFYTSQDDVNSGTDNITDTDNYQSDGTNPQTIFVRLEDANGCFATGTFNLIIVDCLFPDGTVTLQQSIIQCDSRIVTVPFSINNFDSFDVLPSGTPISIYINGEFLDYAETIQDIAIDGSENDYITLTIPDEIPLDFELTFVVDDTGDGTGIVTETDENNNTTTIAITLLVTPVVEQPDNLIACNEGFGIGTFDFSAYENLLRINPDDNVYFYTTESDAMQDSNRISDSNDFSSTSDPQQIFARIDNGSCYGITSFLLTTKKCPPTTYNYVTPNNDGYNDSFFVEGLRNIFTDFTMTIYNRWGELVWKGDHSKEDWNGIASVAKVGSENNSVPVGTYYFVLELNDIEYPEPIVGWVYVTK